jgi:nucleotide-binding universal stress UspA family protein
MERWLLGSVAERVMRGAKMPVLLIRPDQPAAESAAQR